MTYEKNSLLSRGAVSEGAVSISLNDSWTGRKLLEALGNLPPRRFSPEEFDMRYQQKQQLERDQKRSDFAGGRSLAAIDVNDNKLTATLGAGKVRQMFDERRHRTTGIDKSYPLQPISTSRKSPVPTIQKSSNNKSNNGNSNGTKRPYRLPTSADGQLENIASNRANGNYLISNKLSDGDYLDNEMFPDESLDDTDFNMLDDDSMTMTKLPEVRKQLSGLSLKTPGNGSLLKLRTSGNFTKHGMGETHQSILPSKPLNGNRKLTPVAAPPLLTSTSNAVPTLGRNNTLVARSVKPSITQPKSAKSKTSTRNNSARMATPKSVSPTIKEVPAGMSSCKICGRNFNTDRLQKHETICQKAASKKRKIFDATIHRVKGTEAEQYVKKAIRQHQRKVVGSGAAAVAETITATAALQAVASPAAAKKSDWRRKHEEFIAAIRSAKQVQVHLAKGGKLSDLPPPPPSENPDYVQCPHCSRRFNSSAAERHIPKCANFQFNKPKPKAAITKKKY